ncbi:WD40 repeat domain-containing protein [Streptosporangiaceae bacterium NEAU-GS5]|nr:WD40 repeat domain-containing protein [Streptosporangiaceae bacterium NEAU-GS5]
MTQRAAAHRPGTAHSPASRPSSDAPRRRSAASPGLGILGSAHWPQVYLTPGPTPLTRLVDRLRELGDLPAEDIVQTLRTDPRRAAALFRPLVAPGDRIVLTVDQFEELFAADPKERDSYIKALTTLSTGDEHGPVALVVLAVRADYYTQCIELPTLLPTFDDGPVIITAMTVDEVRSVIEGPAAAARLTLEPGLVPLIMRDFGVQEFSLDSAAGAYEAHRLPLLSHALYATWINRRDQALTISGYRKTRGIHGALDATAERTYHELDEQARVVARGVFVRLVNPGDEGRTPTRRAVRPDALYADISDTSGVQRVLAAFAADGARLVSFDQDSIEITHETLVTAWKRLGTWIAESREVIVKEQAYVGTAELWTRTRDDKLLLQDAELEAASKWLDADHMVEPSRVAVRFIRAGLDRQRRRQRRVADLRWVAMAAVLIMIAGAGAFAVQKISAANTAKAAEVAQRLLRQAESLATSQPATSLLLRRASMLINPTPAARVSMVSALMSNHLAGTVRTGAAPLQTVAFQPGGSIMIAGGADGDVSLIDVTDVRHPRLISTLTGHDATVNAAAFSPDGRLAVTGGDDHMALLWDFSAPARPRLLARLYVQARTSIYTLAFRPDGQTLFVGGSEGYAALWDIRDAADPHAAALPGARGTIRGAAFGRSGALLATANENGDFSIWATDRPDRPTRIQTSPVKDTLYSAAFSPDGYVVSAAGLNGSVTRWDVASSGRLSHPSSISGTDRVNSLAFTPDGAGLFVAGADLTMKPWNAAEPPAASTERVFARQVQAIAGFSVRDDGRVIATAGADGTAALWYVDDPAHPAVTASLTSSSAGGDKESNGPVQAAFAVKNTLLVHTSCCGPPRLVELTDPRHPTTIDAFGTVAASVDHLAYDPRNGVLATVDRSGWIMTWRLSESGKAVLLGQARSSSGRPFREIVLSPDGRTAIVNGDDDISAWDISDPKNPRQLATVEHWLPTAQHFGSTLAFSPDGHTLAGSSDQEAMLWELSDPGKPLVRASLAGARGPVAFAHNGAVLITLEESARELILWDVRDTAHPVKLTSIKSSGTLFDRLVVSPQNVLAVDGGGGEMGVTLFDLADARHPRQLTTLAGSTVGAFSPDGRWLVVTGPIGPGAASPSSAGLLLDIAQVTQIVQFPQVMACAVAGRELTRHEWEAYIPDLDFRPVCPA